MGMPIGIDVVYLVVGKLTGLLAGLKAGDAVEIWGPLGNGFPEPLGDQHVALVAGGIGQTPFLAHIRELLGTRGYGGRTAAPPRSDAFPSTTASAPRISPPASMISKAPARPSISPPTTAASATMASSPICSLNMNRPQHLFGCGPEPMLHALAMQADQRGIPCHLSLETPMACGVGICFSCVTPGEDRRRLGL